MRPVTVRLNGTQTQTPKITSKIHGTGILAKGATHHASGLPPKVSTRSHTELVSAQLRSASMSPPGLGRIASARPSATAPVASVAMIGWMRPTTTINPFINPKAVPHRSVMNMPKTICPGEPVTTSEAIQLVSVITAPTERSRPPIRTGIVCAMATKAMATLSLAF